MLSDSKARLANNRTNLGIKLCLTFLLALSLSGCISAKNAPSDNQVLASRFEQGGLVAKITPRGVVVYLPSVMFLFGSAELTSEASDKVEFIARVSNEKMAIKRNIVVEGHTDSVGSDEENMQLSETRANAVSTLLLNNDVESKRVETTWFGESRPLIPNTLSDGSDNPEGRAANRRVEFILLNK